MAAHFPETRLETGRDGRARVDLAAANRKQLVASRIDSARIYISEYDLYKIRHDAGARLQVQGQFRTWPARVVAMAARPVEIDPKLVGEVQLQGMNPPHYYIVDLIVSSADGALKPGMTGVARVYGDRRSLLGMAWEGAKNFWERKIW